MVIDNTYQVTEVHMMIPYSVDKCTLGKAPFYGEIEIIYKPSLLLIEFEAFEAWLFGICRGDQIVESLCRLVFDKLSAVLGDIPLRVLVHARTTVHAPVMAIIERKGD